MADTISLQQAAARQIELFAILSRTEHANSDARVNELESSLDDIRAKMAEQSKVISAAQAEVRKFEKKPSSTKRLASKLFGKSKDHESAGPSESEQKAGQALADAQAVRESMFSVLKETEQEKKGILAEREEHVAATAELDTLYERAFSGPTPEVPGEDELEQKLKTLQAQVSGLSAKAANEAAVAKNLRDSARINADAEQSILAAKYEVENGPRKAPARGLKTPLEYHLDNSMQQVEQSRFFYNLAAARQPLLPKTLIAQDVEGQKMFDEMATFFDVDHGRRVIILADVVVYTGHQITEITKEQITREETTERERATAASELDTVRKELAQLRFQHLQTLGSQQA